MNPINSNQSIIDISKDITSHNNLSSKERFSNYEGMRVFAMILVLVTHCVFFSCGSPDYSTVLEHPLSYLYYSGVESLGLVCVNCFVLISGYFGIKIRLRNVVNLLFIFVFYKFSSLIIATVVMGRFPMDYIRLAEFLVSYQPDWFFWAYMFMLLFVPMMNMYMAIASKKSMIVFIALYVGVEAFSCYTVYFAIDFVGGFSAFALIPIYIIGAFYRKHIEQNLSIRTRRCGLLVYLGVAVLAPILILIQIYNNSDNYDFYINLQNFLCSPLVIAASVGVLMFFSSLSFKSPFINWLGRSAFAVYIIHLNPFVINYFCDCARWIYAASWPWLWLPAIILFSCAVYFCCTLVDQLRILVWNALAKCFKF